MRICVIAGMIDEKLHSKIAPLQNIDEISHIHLIRRKAYNGEKITCHTPPSILSKWLLFAEIWRLLTLLCIALFQRPKVIIAFGTVPHGIYAWLVGKLFFIPVIQHVMGKNDLRLTFDHLRGKKLTLNAVKNADKIAVRGTQMAEWLKCHGVCPDKLFTPQNIHDFELFSPDQQHTPRFDLIYIGLLAPYKRVDLLLDAFALAVKKQSNLILMIVGDGSERTKLEEQVKQLNIGINVHFVGNHPLKQLPPFIRDAKAFIMTSQGEGLPMAMIEAMSCGLPVIIPNDADFSEVAIDQKNAIVVQQHQTQAFSDAINNLFSDKKLYDKLRAGALKLRQEKSIEYSLEHQTELWKKNIMKLTKK